MHNVDSLRAEPGGDTAAYTAQQAYEVSHALSDGQQVVVTRANMEAVIEHGMPGDQARELVVGCRTWRIYYGSGQGGQMTVWPNGRGAVAYGGDSTWGDWDADRAILQSEDGEVIDQEGSLWPSYEAWAAEEEPQIVGGQRHIQY